jgi:protein TonB
LTNRTLASRPVDRLGLTLLLATGIHAALILGLSFDVDLPSSTSAEALSVTIVRNLRGSHKPDKPDFAAQANQEGGGAEETPVKPKTQLSPPSVQVGKQPARETLQGAPPRPARAEHRVLTAIRSPRRIGSETPAPPTPALSRPTAAEMLAQRSQEIARITAELDRRTEAYAKRPRRKFISASTKEVKYAFYQEAWRRKVERIGTLNYPEEAKRAQIYGTLVLHCAVRADGTVESIDIQRSSGIKVLDDAAVRAVRLAAPFAPFSPDIAAETDILDITRTFRYTSGNQLMSD